MRTLSLRYHTVLIPRDEAPRVIQRLLERPVRVLGIDAFTLFPNDLIQPAMESSVDWSLSQPTPEEAESFMARIQPHITHLEIVLGD